jgi:hypothetical protein
MEFFIAVIVVLVALNVFFFLIFRGITLRLGKFAQINVLRQSGVFDDLIRKKQDQLKQLDAQIAAAKAAAVLTPPVTATVGALAPDFMEIMQGDYADTAFAGEYRTIRDSFQLDTVACVKESLAKLPGPSAKAAAAQGILDILTLDIAYELSTLSSYTQRTFLTRQFDDQQKQLLQEFEGQAGEFQSHRFLFWLKDYVTLHGDQVKVFTGSGSGDFESLDGRIVTDRDESICEGLYLVAQGKKYDYSISSREIMG